MCLRISRCCVSWLKGIAILFSIFSERFVGNLVSPVLLRTVRFRILGFNSRTEIFSPDIFLSASWIIVRNRSIGGSIRFEVNFIFHLYTYVYVFIYYFLRVFSIIAYTHTLFSCFINILWSVQSRITQCIDWSSIGKHNSLRIRDPTLFCFFFFQRCSITYPIRMEIRCHRHIGHWLNPKHCDFNQHNLTFPLTSESFYLPFN